MTDARDESAAEQPGNGPRRGSASGAFATLDDNIDEPGRDQTMAELKAQLERERQAAADGAEPPELSRNARPSPRDDELLDELPATDHHLGRFAGWRAARKLRLIVGVSLGIAVALGALAFILHSRELRHERLHPLPEVEALVSANTPREATYTDGRFRIGISRAEPYINLVHLPDRDITLARWSDTAQFKVEIRDGRTVKLEVLTGEIVETLTRPDAERLLDD